MEEVNIFNYEKGQRIVTSSATGQPSKSIHLICINGLNLGVGLYLDNERFAESAIVKSNKGAKVLRELNSGHPVDETFRKSLVKKFKLYFPDIEL